jgi:aspartate/methionine/tyrosine aminotransferase
MPALAARTRSIEPFRVMEVAEHAWHLAAQGRDVIFLLAGEPDFGTPPQATAAAQQLAATGRVHYTGSLGIPALREAIAAMYAERYGVDVPVARIVVTTGASAALVLALAATVDPGREVIVGDPTYPCNRNFISLFDGVPHRVPVGAASHYQPTLADIGAAWNERTSGVLLATPANPTGTTVAPHELCAIADEVAARDGSLYVDEIYGELVYDTAPSTVLGHTRDAFVVNSFSKTFGMTGWRLGWLVCPEWALDAVTSATQNVYISAPAVAQAAGVACFQPDVWALVEQRRQEFQRRRDVMVAGLRALGFSVPVVPQGAFYVWADCADLADDATVLARHLLDEAGVACTPGIDFDTTTGHRHIRFSYTAPLARIEEALDRMATALTTARRA